MRYTLLLNDQGGIIDDLMVTRSNSENDDGALGLVFNAGRKEIDDDWFCSRLPDEVTLHTANDRALLALQGPEAAKVMARHCPKAESLVFMSATSAEFDGIDCSVSRSGYTGEDGFEISVPARDVETVARTLLAEPEVKPIGLGARDSLRLEAGLPLYGHDLDETTSPVEADLVFAIPKARRASGGFLGDRAHPAGACARPDAQARRHPPVGPRAGARRRRDPRSGWHERSASSPPAASVRP